MKKIGRLFNGIVYWTGFVTVSLLLAVALFAGFCHFEYLADHPSLSSGIVTGHSYDDGHPVSVDYVVGEWTIHKNSGDGKKHFYLEVTSDRGKVDYWEVNQDEYEAVKDGAPVTRDLFK